MTWINTHKIQVPANNNQTIETNINEWFYENPRFLLGKPIANQLRGSNNGWAQTVAIQSDRDVISELRLALKSILVRSNVHVERKTIQVHVKLEQRDRYETVEVEADVYDGVLAIHQPFKTEEEEWIITHVNTGAKLPNEGTFSYQECRDCIYDLLALPINWNSSGFPEMGGAIDKVREILRADCLSKNLRGRLLGEEGGDTPNPEVKHLSQANNEVNTMTSKISADKFEQASGYSFILRHNTQRKGDPGIEIHFPPDAQPKADMIARLMSSGFTQARANERLWYATYNEALMQKARGWIKACARYGAYEIDPSEPIEKIQSRRRKVQATQEKTETPSVPNKLADAVALRVKSMLEEMLPSIIEQVAGSSKEVEQLKAENAQLKETIANQQTVVDEQKLIIEEGMSRLIEIENDRDRLKAQLVELGLEETEEESPVFDDEPEEESPVFADEPICASQQRFAIAEESVFDEEETEEGFDLDEVGE